MEERKGNKCIRGINNPICNSPPPSPTCPKDKLMSSPPGPRGPPLIGQAFNLDTSHMHLNFMEWQKQHGDIFMFKVFGKHYLVISHPDILREMFVKCEHAHRFNDRPAGFMGNYVIGKAQDIVFRNCDDKQKALKMAVRDYIETQLPKDKWFYDAVCEEMDDMVKGIDACKDKPVNLLETLDTVASKVIGLMLSGHRMQADSPEYKCLTGFMETGNQLGTVKNQTILTAVPMMRKFPGHLRDIYNDLTEEKEKLKKYFIEESTSTQGLVAMLKRLGKDEDWLTDEFILGVILDHTAAAIVPLQNTLSVLILVLVHHPKIQDQIRAELEQLTSHPTVDDVPRMPYTSACILELKRFHTPLPISARHSNRSGDAKFEKYNIPKNTEIFSNLFGMHHDERMWGEPWSFKPERFIKPDGQLVPDDHPNMKNLVPTGVGPRACVASTFSENILFLCATSLLQKFSILPTEGHAPPACDPRTFLSGVVTRSPDFTCTVQGVPSSSNGVTT